MQQKQMRDEICLRIRQRLDWIHSTAGDTVGGALKMRLLETPCEQDTFRFLASTENWMRNVIGTLHGGSCAVMVDQAMGCVANCVISDPTPAPTSQLQLNFHRPMLAGEDHFVDVQLVNLSVTMVHLQARVYACREPDKICVSASSIFFRRKKKGE